MSRWWCLFLLVGSLLLSGCGSRPKPLATGIPQLDIASAQMPMKYQDYNLVFISFDALQAAHLGALGYREGVTPTLDTFAKQAFTFQNAYSVASWTVPASMTWFTGVYPSEHRMTNKYTLFRPPIEKTANLKQLSPNILTLAEILRTRGYATVGFTGNAGVSSVFGYDQGFDIYSFDPGRFGGLDVSIPRALEWLRVNRSRKFFLFLHGYDVHGQYVPAGGYDYRFVAKGYDRRYTGSAAEQETLREEGLEKGTLTLRDADVQFWRAIYDEKINRADERFRRFLVAFAEMELMDRTLFVITSDHGTELFEHHRIDHGYSLYNELIRVPLFIRLPGQQSRGNIAERVSSIDLMPTILHLLDVPIDTTVKQKLRGQSLVPIMRGERYIQEIISETDYREYTYKRSIITPAGWKLIYTLESKQRELFDLNTDPHERDNQASVNTVRADELERRLFAHFVHIGHDLMARQWNIGLNPVYSSQAPRK